MFGLLFASVTHAWGDWKTVAVTAGHGEYPAAFDEDVQSPDSDKVYAMHNLGVRYYNGIGVVRDYAMALRLFHEAALQGLASSQNNVGFMYAYGHGVQQDFVKALMWFRIADAYGESTAMQNSEILVGHISAADREEANRLAQEWIERNTGIRD
ncbi:MAG: tetratricopeptide repeat protein [Pseudomonadota bacterium]